MRVNAKSCDEVRRPVAEHRISTHGPDRENTCKLQMTEQRGAGASQQLSMEWLTVEVALFEVVLPVAHQLWVPKMSINIQGLGLHQQR